MRKTLIDLATEREQAVGTLNQEKLNKVRKALSLPEEAHRKLLNMFGRCSEEMTDKMKDDLQWALLLAQLDSINTNIVHVGELLEDLILKFGGKNDSKIVEPV